jgi:hypothetical protein
VLPSLPVLPEPAARDSVCEQCHLIGVARILNPGKKFTDFAAGKPLEETFTIYHNESPMGSETAFKVISHSEQLALANAHAAAAEGCGVAHATIRTTSRRNLSRTIVGAACSVTRRQPSRAIILTKQATASAAI